MRRSPLTRVLSLTFVFLIAFPFSSNATVMVRVEAIAPATRDSVFQDGLVKNASPSVPVAGTWNVQPSGAFTYSIPLEGTDLSLAYDARAGNGLLGVKWRLDGAIASSIIRTKVGNHPINYNDEDTFAISSGYEVSAGPDQRLVRQGTTNFYRTTKERWERYQRRGMWQRRPDESASPAYFVRELKDGSKVYYGGDETCNADPGSPGYYLNRAGTCRWDGGRWAAGEIWGPVTFEKNDDPLSGNPRGIFRWHLYKIVDPMGNVTKVDWVWYQQRDRQGNALGRGMSYPWRITYGLKYASKRKFQVVEFGYENRALSDWSPAPNFFSLILREVRVKVQELVAASAIPISDVPLHKFVLGYTSSHASGRSLLTSVQKQGHDCPTSANAAMPWLITTSDLSCPNGKKLPAQSFTWQDEPLNNGAYVRSRVTNPHRPRMDLSPVTDRVRYRDTAGAGSDSPAIQWMEFRPGFEEEGEVHWRETMDENDPGYLKTSRRKRFPGKYVMGDINGDGRGDAVTFYELKHEHESRGTPENMTYVYYGTDQGFGPPRVIAGCEDGEGCGDSESSMMMVDVNGDGFQDYVVGKGFNSVGTSALWVAAALGGPNGLGALRGQSLSLPRRPSVAGDPEYEGGDWRVFPLDANGDGKMDVALVNARRRLIALAEGGDDGLQNLALQNVRAGWPVLPHPTEEGKTRKFPDASAVFPMDVNSDGRQDIVLWYHGVVPANFDECSNNLETIVNLPHEPVYITKNGRREGGGPSIAAGGACPDAVAYDASDHERDQFAYLRFSLSEGEDGSAHYRQVRTHELGAMQSQVDWRKSLVPIVMQANGDS
ncbi:MAG: hypothetical protein HY540_02230, partial [Deltaproteobacteria bacterium]|nr:hypothetical protein [Deltaproteobacteria bacterium]